MEEKSKTIILRGSQSLMPDDPATAYRISRGSVIIYIAPLQGEFPGKRLPLCEAETGRTIPSFVYRDQEYRQWRLILVAREEAELVEMKASVTSILKRNFIKKRKGTTQVHMKHTKETPIRAIQATHK